MHNRDQRRLDRNKRRLPLTMSNMYGYSDYHGPGLAASATGQHDQLEEELNPLQAGFWMEGDSLAPPCGTSVSTIADILKLSHVGPNDVVYDFGCGDARVCLEAAARYGCRTIGVEIEADLVARAQELIATLPESTVRPRVIQQDLRQVLDQLVARAKDQSQEESDDLPLPTVIILYLLPEAIAEIESRLLELLKLSPSLRILCNTWGLRSIQPTVKQQVHEASLAITPLFLYDKTCLNSTS